MICSSTTSLSKAISRATVGYAVGCRFPGADYSRDFHVFHASNGVAWVVVVVARCRWKIKGSLDSEDQIKTTFADVAGCDEAKDDVAELVEFLKDQANSRLGGRIPRGVLMAGPPGTVKHC